MVPFITHSLLNFNRPQSLSSTTTLFERHSLSFTPYLCSPGVSWMCHDAFATQCHQVTIPVLYYPFGVAFITIQKSIGGATRTGIKERISLVINTRYLVSPLRFYFMQILKLAWTRPRVLTFFSCYLVDTPVLHAITLRIRTWLCAKRNAPCKCFCSNCVRFCWFFLEFVYTLVYLYNQSTTRFFQKLLKDRFKGTNGRQKTCEIFHVYCIFYSGFMCQTTVIFGITKDGSLVLNPLAPWNCFTCRNLFQNGANDMSEWLTCETAFCKKAQNFV